MLVNVVKAVTRRVLPGGAKVRTLPFGPAAGCKVKINLHHNLRLYLGLYERETQAWFPRLIKPGYRSFDVGGAEGYDALLAAKLSGGGEVVSFECEPQLAAGMRETFEANPYSITTVEEFVDDTDGGGHTTLDAAARRFFVPDFIKMDIEGAEDKALAGAVEIIDGRKPNMIVEVHGADVEARCLEFLKAHGYEPVVVDRAKFFREGRTLDHNRWLICKGRDFTN